MFEPKKQCFKPWDGMGRPGRPRILAVPWRRRLEGESAGFQASKPPEGRSSRSSRRIDRLVECRVVVAPVLGFHGLLDDLAHAVEGGGVEAEAAGLAAGEVEVLEQQGGREVGAREVARQHLGELAVEGG